MFLKYNITNIKRERRALTIKSYNISEINSDNNYCLITFTTDTPHKLSVGDSVIFKKSILVFNQYTDIDFDILESESIIRMLNSDSNKEKGYYFVDNDKNLIGLDEVDAIEKLNEYNQLNKNLTVLSDNFTDTTFSISYEIRQRLQINNKYENDDYEWISLNNDVPIIAESGYEMAVNKVYYTYNYNRTITNNDYDLIEVDDNPETIFDYRGYEIVFMNKIFRWSVNKVSLTCEYADKKAIINKYEKNNFVKLLQNDTIEIESMHIFNQNDEQLKFRYDVKLFENAYNLNTPVSISSSTTINFNDDNTVKLFFNEKKDSLINKIVDYEKVCFLPCYKRVRTPADINTGTKSSEFTPINKIKFNLFFRDRSDSENWNSNDTMGWNQYKMRGNSFEKPKQITDGDLLGYLNFTDDDVYYRKQKINKSFLRLSFYSTNDPMNNMLLFYSTIFLDTNDLYNKYIKNKYSRDNEQNGILDIVENDSFGEDNLTASFEIYDKHNKVKSSEGFYLYLFPDDIDPITGKTIYMKAEFNHAGYGKTIPLIYPNNGRSLLSFKDIDFPTSLINEENGDISEYYRQLYIPIGLMYDDIQKEYIYYFKMNRQNNPSLTINLFEPKINPLN